MKDMKWSIRWQAVLMGTGIGILTMVTACAGAAVLMARGSAGLDSMGLFAAGILVLMGLSGALAALVSGGSALDAALTVLAALVSGGSALDAALTVLGEMVVLVGLNCLICGGQMEGIGVTTLTLAGGSGAAILMRLRSGKGHKRRRRRR